MMPPAAGQPSAISPPHQLLPPPTLEEKHLVCECAEDSVLGKLEALVPAGEPYLCRDPHAPAFVLVPGLGMDGLGFVRQLPLGAHARLHFFQTPNQPVMEEQGLNRFARYVEAYIQARKLDQHPGGVVLGGCSMGGAISLSVAIRARVKLRGLVLIGTFGSSRHLPRWQRAAAPLAWVLPMGLMRKLAWQMVARTRFFGAVSPHEADWLVSCKIKRSQRYFGHAIAALTRMEHIPDAARLRVPTLVLHGTHDHVLPHAAGQELASTIPNARFKTIENSGHALFFSDHDAVNRSIAEFLMELRAAPPPSA